MFSLIGICHAKLIDLIHKFRGLDDGAPNIYSIAPRSVVGILNIAAYVTELPCQLFNHNRICKGPLKLTSRDLMTFP